MKNLATKMLLGLLTVTILPSAALAISPSCEGKRAWQREVVAEIIQAWSQGTTPSRPDALLYLVHAELGLISCSESGIPPRLHTPLIPADLAPEDLGGLLLASELKWRGLVERPEVGVVGVTFRLRRHPVPTEDSVE